MKLILIFVIAIVGFIAGYLFFAPVMVEPYQVISLSEATSSPDEDVYVAPPMDAMRELETLLPDIICAAFALFAAYLLIKSPHNYVITIFSVVILSTIFGRWVGPLVIPDFLKTVLQLSE